MIQDISTWQVLTEDFCALQGGEGKKQREKLCRYFCKDKFLEKLNTQGSQSWKGKGLGAHEAVGKLLAPEQTCLY